MQEVWQGGWIALVVVEDARDVGIYNVFGQ